MRRLSVPVPVPFLCAFLAAALLGPLLPPVSAQQEIFVTNANGNSVTVYRRTVNGNIAPKRTLSGGATGLNGPSGVAVDDVNDELLVVNNGMPHSVTVYPRLADGNESPLRTISGNLTGLNGPRGLAVDNVNNEIAVANRVGNTVTVYSRTANLNAAPLRIISGPGTNLSNPWGIYIDTTNSEFVVASNGGFLAVHLRTADENATPTRLISGSNTGFNNGPIGVSVDPFNNEIAVTNPFFGMMFQPSVLVFGRTINGNLAPSRSLFGAMTGLSSPNGLVLDPAFNELLVVNSLANSVTVYGRTDSGNATPIRTLAGNATLLNNPQFLAVTTSPAALLDVDEDGQVEALTDGLLVVRHEFGFQGMALAGGAIDLVNCTRCDGPAVSSYLTGIGALDIDFDGELVALTDGLLVLRYLFGFRGNALIGGAVDLSDCVRCDATAIEGHIGPLTM